MRRSRRPRSSSATARHAGNAVLARATAASVSSTPACSSSAIDSSVAGSTTCTVFAGLAYELLEQAPVPTLFRMPGHAECEAVLGILDRLDRAVFGARRDAQPATNPAEALMVMRLHGHAVTEE